MDTSKWTLKTQEAFESAVSNAERNVNPEVVPEHLALALISQSDGLALPIVQKLGIAPLSLRNRLEEKVTKLPKSYGGRPQMSQALIAIFNEADRRRQTLGDDFVSVEHLMVALSDVLGVKEANVLEVIEQVRGTHKASSNNPEETYRSLERFGRDLTDEARRGKIDPVIGRDEEIRRIIQILSRRTKNNPVLIGEPGVGKTAIVEGLATRIIEGDVPEGLKGKRVVSLDLGGMVAGAKYRGEFEERLKSVLKEIVDSEGEIITFVDEMHTVIGAGAAEGSLDASNMLKPLLARGELRMIGATTLDEYRKHVEQDPALERRFQRIVVNPPSVDDTVAILRGLKERYEVHHGVRIQDQALVAAAMLSDRYITDRFLPDKAIDLVDEAASRLRIEIDSRPTEIDVVERRIRQLEIERISLSKEADQLSIERMEKLDEELANLKERLSAMSLTWQTEKDAISKIRTKKEDLEQARSQAEVFERDGALDKASEIRYGKIPALQMDVDRATEELAKLQSQQRMLKEEVDDEDIAEVVSKATGVPVSRLLASEMTKLLRMEENLHLRVVGQDEAVNAVSNAIRRSRAGLSDPDRPIGSFLFIGPTGVGKTELARALAEFLFDDVKAMIRIDMSEYQESHSVARLIGAPPGYVGYDEGGQLTEAVKRRPYSVILLDEIEKAHQDVFNILLQVLDDGRLTDGQGRTINFTNTILIMTSNLAVDPKVFFKPEFVNRVDEIINFQPLSQEALREIVEIQLGNVERRLAAKNIGMEVSNAAKDWLATKGFDPVFGARPLKRVIQREVGDQIASGLLSGHYSEGGRILVDVDPVDSDRLLLI